MEPKYAGYAQKEFYLDGTNVIGRVGINLSYWDNGMLEVRVKGFSGGKKVDKDTLSAKRADMIKEVVEEIAKDVDIYNYLRVFEPGTKKDCRAGSPKACLECCTGDYLPKCHAPESKTPGEAGVSLNGSQLVESERRFRSALKECIDELMMIA